ncbi:ExbD/TolR family protein [Phaeobacter gallaeciensis]|uniref:ExbD/TolR family protein n=1 Tax=Phaeobacter gallaeciensis TaxID=60890 RepID=UPI000BBC4AD5|nr:biopolymer transporter ExbD [Phaeobacter gallaeciensis]ATF19904.1 Biopolymer transport protein [Phaeobacter gallaeciensis]ATF24013.1 Biopolymer transport protein [Phaeobacter gallaeciensis]
MRIRPHKARQKEPTIALINIVFLMLIFFMIAGTLAVPLDKDVTLIEAKDLEGREPPDALVVHADGRLTLRGKVLADAATYAAMLTEEERAEVRIVPDRDLPARDLVKLGNALRAAGAQNVLLVSERALP